MQGSRKSRRMRAHAAFGAVVAECRETPEAQGYDAGLFFVRCLLLHIDNITLLEYDDVCVFIHQDRPDLIQSELAGLAFDSLQQVFRKCDVAIMFDSPCMPFTQDQMIWVTIDPAGTFSTCMTI